MMERILVTGASGFVGRQVVESLQASGKQIFAVSRQAPAHARDKAQWVEIDLLETVAAKELVASIRPTHMIHLAWCASPGTYLTSPDNLRWLEASLELLREFAQSGGERVVGVGTCLEYDLSAGELCVEGITPLAPSTLYGACKQALGTVMVQAAAVLGLSSSWVRLFHLYGPHEHPDRLVPAVINSILKGKEIRLNQANRKLDYLAVVEAGHAITAVLRSDFEGAVNVGSGQVVTVREVAEVIARAKGREELLRYDGAMAGEEMLAPDTARLNKEIGWAPSTTLQEGLLQTLSWWENR